MAVTGRREYQVAKWLEDAGWFTLVPLREFWRLEKGKRAGKGARRVKEVAPVLGGFVFAGLHGAPNWLALERCFHLKGPINVHGVPLRLPEYQVSVFQRKAALAALLGQETGVLKAGIKARVTAGAYQGHELDIRRIKGPWADVLVKLFGGEVEARIRVDHLEAA
jgi:hypothetical protein